MSLVNQGHCLCSDHCAFKTFYETFIQIMPRISCLMFITADQSVIKSVLQQAGGVKIHTWNLLFPDLAHSNHLGKGGGVI